MTVTYLVATTGRPTLARTLKSIECWPGDELLVVGSMGPTVDPRVRFLPHRPGKDWGHTERNYAMRFATGAYLAHLDDDDIYLPGARAAMAQGIEQTPGRPIVFKTRWPDGGVLWTSPVLRFGNVGTPMTLMPNVPAKFGTWGRRYGGDFDFLKTSKWAPTDYAWRPEIIVQVKPR